MQSSAKAPPTPTWQHPYVEVIRYGLAHSNVGFQQHGDVEQITDRQIQKNVFKIRGAIASANYVRFPREVSKSNQGLGLTGRYIYIQLRRAKGQPATLHLDLLTTKKSALRVSLSSMYTTLRSSGTVLRVPLDVSELWTTIAIDMAEMLQLHGFNGYSRESCRYLKAVTCCASMNLRSVFTSSTCFAPQDLPANLALPAAHDNQFGPFAWISLPSALGVRPTPSVLKERRAATMNAEDQSTIFDLRTLEGDRDDDDDGRQTDDEDVAAVSPMPMHQADVDAGEASSPGSPPLSPTSRTAGLLRDREDVLSRADQIMRDAGFSVPSPRRRVQIPDQPNETSISSVIREQETPAAAISATLSPRRYLVLEHSDWPDPILSLTRVIGMSTTFPRALRWIPDAPICVYASYSTIILREFIAEGGGRPPHEPPAFARAHHLPATPEPTTTAGVGEDLMDDREVFLTGHTGEICALTLAQDGSFLASAQNTPQCVLRVWDLRRRSNACVIVMKAPIKTINALAFSKDATALCCVGTDDRARTQIYVWDASSLLASPATVTSVRKLGLKARQTCDFPIHAIAFSPYEPDQLVSCGKENIRFWRIDETRRHLPGSPVILKEYSRGTVFTDVAFDYVYPQFPSNLPRLRPVYVSSSVGSIVVINYDTRDVVCVYKLHDGAINSICVNEGFCVTGSDDKFLRVWPLDFSDFFLEAEHEESVQSVDVSSDGMRVTVGTSSGAVGILHLADQRYRTVLRSHTQPVNALAPLCNGSLVTSAPDGTLRVWDTATGAQTMEFDVSKDLVTCLTAMPGEPSDGSPQIIAAGFRSGSTRIFSLGSSPEAVNEGATVEPRVLNDFQQHQSALCDVQYLSDPKTLYTSAAGQQLCMYDVTKGYTPIKMLIADIDTDPGKLCLSRDRRFVAVVQQGRRSVLLLDAVSLTVVRVLTPPKSSQPATSDSLDGAQEITQVLISCNSQELLSLTRADRLYVFSLSEASSGSQASVQFGSVIHSMPLLGQFGITAFTLSPNLKYMATGGSDSSVRIWQFEFGKHKPQRMNQTFRLHAGQGAVRGLVFSSDGCRVIATSDTSSALQVWRFRGNTSKLPTLELQADATEATHHADTLQGHKAEFELPLGEISNKKEADSSIVATEAESPKSPEIAQLRLSTSTVDVHWKRTISAVRRLSQSCYAWACGIGCLVSTVGDSSVVVVEEIESGKQHFLHVAMPIERLVLSPNHLQLAILSTNQDVAMVYDLHQLRKTINQTEDDDQVPFAPHTTHVKLYRQLERIAAVEISVDGTLLCISGEVSCQPELFVVDIPSGGELNWRVASPSAFSITSIISQSTREFLCATKDARQPFQRLRVPPFPLSATLLALELVGTALPVAPHAFGFRDDGPVSSGGSRCRIGVVLDSEAYCYFMDFERERMIHTMQLLLPSARSTITTIRWVGSNDWQALVTTLSDDTIAVFALPTQFSFTASKVRVASIDWIQLKRTTRLSCASVLKFDGLSIAHVLQDPLSNVGIVTTRNGAVYAVNFQSGQRRLVLAAPSLVLSSVSRHSSPRLALHGAIVLTLSSDRRALQCWEPTIGRELARLQVANASCSCFTTSAFDAQFAAAGYEDGSLRVFDVNKQQLLAQCVLPPLPPRGKPFSSAKSGAMPPPEALSILKEKQATMRHAVGGTKIFKELHFIGPRCVLAVTGSSRVVLFDMSDANVPTGDETSSGTIISAEGSGKRASVSTRKTKEKLIHFRELHLPPPDRIKWLTKTQKRAMQETGAISAEGDVCITHVEVQQRGVQSPTKSQCQPRHRANDLDDNGDGLGATQGFLIVVKRTTRSREIRVAYVFAANTIPATHPVHAENDTTPCDAWIVPQRSGDPVFHPTNACLVVSPVFEDDATHCIEIRDFRAHAVVLQLTVPGTVDIPQSPSSLMRWHELGKAVVVLVDAHRQPLAVLDLAKRTVVRINVNGHGIPLSMSQGLSCDSSVLLTIPSPNNNAATAPEGTAAGLVVADLAYSNH